MINRIINWWIGRQFKPIPNIKFTGDFFDLTFSSNWIFRKRRSGEYEFAIPEEINGVLQIGALFSEKNNHNGFDINEVLEKTINLENKTAKIIKLGDYEAVYYKQLIKKNSIFDYRWYIRHENIFLVITFNQEKDQELEVIEKELKQIKHLIEGIKIKNA